MKFQADLEIFATRIEVDCFFKDGEITDIIEGENDYSELLNNPYVCEQLHRQLEDYLANLKAGV